MILYVAQSVDGYLAHLDGGIDFLEQDYERNCDLKDEMLLDYPKFIAGIDVVLLGYRTYIQIKEMGIEDQYPGLESYVITDDHQDVDDSSMDGFIGFEEFCELDLEDRRVYLVGGASLIKSCFMAKLVREVNLFVMPKILNNGIRLFDNVDCDLVLRSVDHSDYIVNINYDVKYEESNE